MYHISASTAHVCCDSAFEKEAPLAKEFLLKVRSGVSFEAGISADAMLPRIIAGHKSCLAGGGGPHFPLKDPDRGH